MTAADLLPPIPRPPDDPTWWLLDGRVGWRMAALENVEISPLDGALALKPEPNSGRFLAEPSGSFGGLTVPAHVAIGPAGAIYLLDRRTATLKVFDPCDCVFLPTPCFGGVGAGARQLQSPQSIGIHRGNLFVCDTGNRRLSIFSLRGFVLRGHWSPPTEAGLTNPWEPFGVAFGAGGHVFVTDRANGCVHRFASTGRWIGCFQGFGSATHLAIDCAGRIYVVVEGSMQVRHVNAGGEDLKSALRPAEVASDFRCPPLEVDEAGILRLGAFCDPPSEETGAFDPNGDPLGSVPNISPQQFFKAGTYWSEALDSELYRCQWHRVSLAGAIPEGARVRVLTYTAETELPLSHIEALPDNAWATRQTTIHLPNEGEWDCLVRSGPGRFIWLRLELLGNGSATPSLTEIRAEYPRISLSRFLPGVFGEEPVSKDFTDRFLGIFDSIHREIEWEIDWQARYFDPLATPTQRDPATGIDFLSWLGSWIGLSLPRALPEAKRRRLLKASASGYAMRGTREFLRRQLVAYLGMEPEERCCVADQPRSRCLPVPANCAPPVDMPCAWQPPPLILEHFQLRRWLFLGAGRLGDQAQLWGKSIVNRSRLDHGAQVDGTQLKTSQDPHRDPFHVYAHKFSIFVPASCSRSPEMRASLESLVASEKPAHTQAELVLVEPRFRIGLQSMIGLDSVVGRYPEGIQLGLTTLGPASVLEAPPHKKGGPELEVGTTSRVAATTRLN